MRVQGPVLAGGFLGVQFSGLRDVVVVGLINCERVVLGKGAKVLISECSGNLATTSWKMKLMGRKDRMRREEMVGKKKKVE